MKAVNNITQFFLRGMLTMCKALRADGRKTPVDDVNDARIKAGDSLDDPDIQNAMQEAVQIQVTVLIGATVASVLEAVNEAGRVMVKFNELTKNESRPDFDELNEKALAAATSLAGSLPVLKAMAAHALDSTDTSHIGEVLFSETLPRLIAAEKGASPVPPATPVSGSATPLHPRWQPSAN